jgi:MoaA/NifB/PqqE/SkfB family radical SAM enzyme
MFTVDFLTRLAKQVRLRWLNLAIPRIPSPPFVVLFINSICNMKCEHCFYWQSLNRPDDLSFDELVSLSEELGPIENLNLSGGEPFLRKEFGAICRQFIRRNGVKEIYVSTNAYFTDKMVAQIRETLREPALRLFVAELSLDGTAEFHDRFRVARGSFAKAMETYDALEQLQREDPRLQIHAVSTATADNMEEIRRLTTFLFERCPQMTHHNLALIRGDRKNPSLQGPKLAEYRQLYDYIRRLWSPREQGRYGALVEPMLQWAKIKTAEERRQVIPCRAGVLSAVIYANGDVSVCEQHVPLGNLRRSSFNEIWYSQPAYQRRAAIRAKECHCTNETFLWPSITYQTGQMLRALLGARAWRKATPLPAAERVAFAADAVGLGSLQRPNGERAIEKTPTAGRSRQQ